jgi:hypothetical protein
MRPDAIWIGDRSVGGVSHRRVFKQDLARLRPSADSVGVECVSQEDADTEEHSQRDYDLGHRRAHWLAVPGTTALRNCR